MFDGAFCIRFDLTKWMDMINFEDIGDEGSYRPCASAQGRSEHSMPACCWNVIFPIGGAY